MLQGRVRLKPLSSTVLNDKRCPATTPRLMVRRNDRMVRCKSETKNLWHRQVVWLAMHLGAALRPLRFTLLTNRTSGVLGKMGAQVALWFDLGGWLMLLLRVASSRNVLTVILRHFLSGIWFWRFGRCGLACFDGARCPGHSVTIRGRLRGTLILSRAATMVNIMRPC